MDYIFARDTAVTCSTGLELCGSLPICCDILGGSECPAETLVLLGTTTCIPIGASPTPFTTPTSSIESSLLISTSTAITTISTVTTLASTTNQSPLAPSTASSSTYTFLSATSPAPGATSSELQESPSATTAFLSGTEASPASNTPTPTIPRVIIKDTLSIGAIAGVSIGGSLFVVLVSFLIFALVRRKKGLKMVDASYVNHEAQMSQYGDFGRGSAGYETRGSAETGSQYSRPSALNSRVGLDPHIGL